MAPVVQEVLKARQKRADLARAHEQIVCIQASIRMFLARRRFRRLRAAALCAPHLLLPPTPGPAAPCHLIRRRMCRMGGIHTALASMVLATAPVLATAESLCPDARHSLLMAYLQC